MLNIVSLIVLPLAAFFLIPFTTKLLRDYISVFFVLILAFISINIFISQEFVHFSFTHIMHMLLLLLDVVVIVFFLSRGIVENNKKVSILAAVQLILYALFIFLEPTILSHDVIIDKISSIMMLVINIVGGIIIIYALKYIEEENFTKFKKNVFIALLFFFLSVMNLIVATNSLEIFFLCFELTTLCSYLLIRYREDDISKENALRALWMNQIGGVAILVVMVLSTIYYDSIYFDVLLTSIEPSHIFIIAILTLAAFVKGASIPFEKWLLGAMVAPTPVSAILHSATMVKIAPYLMLKISAVFTPFMSSVIVLLGMFVFMGASIMALSRDYFKEILGLSTVALLAFMMAIAAIGTPEAINICLIMIVFHAISKALLFLQAGVLEKQFHFKYLSDINYLIDRSPLSVFMILIGFASLTLPPFGAFLAKFFSIELMVQQIMINPVYILSFIFMIIGSVVLTLLYFKVITKMLSNKNINEDRSVVRVSPLYKYTSLSLFILLLVGIAVSFDFNTLTPYQVIVPTILIFVIPIILFILRSKDVNIVKEYNCGEKDEVEIGAFYFDIKERYLNNIKYISLSAMVFLVLGSLFW